MNRNYDDFFYVPQGLDTISVSKKRFKELVLAGKSLAEICLELGIRDLEWPLRAWKKLPETADLPEPAFVEDIRQASRQRQRKGTSKLRVTGREKLLNRERSGLQALKDEIKNRKPRPVDVSQPMTIPDPLDVYGSSIYGRGRVTRPSGKPPHRAVGIKNILGKDS